VQEPSIGRDEPSRCELGPVRTPFRIAAWFVGPAFVLASLGGLTLAALEYLEKGSASLDWYLVFVLIAAGPLGVRFIIAAYTGYDPVAQRH
jgi:hypothetical protein